jgi:hypothetical protein
MDLTVTNGGVIYAALATTGRCVISRSWLSWPNTVIALQHHRQGMEFGSQVYSVRLHSHHVRLSPRRTAPATRGEPPHGPESASMLDRDTLPIPWMRLYARARPSASDALYTNASEELASLPEPELVFCEPQCPILVSGGSGRRCDPSLGPFLPNSRHTYSTLSTPTASTSAVSHATSASTAILSVPASQIPPGASLSQAHDSDVRVLTCLTFYPLGHLPVSASKDNTTRFQARSLPATLLPSAAVAPDDDSVVVMSLKATPDPRHLTLMSNLLYSTFC